MPRLSHRVLSICVIATTAWAASQATWAEPAKEEGVRYTVEIAGLKGDDGLKDKIRGLSQLVELRDKPPHSIFVLEDRAKEDRGLIRKFLRSEGYYAGRVDVDLKESVKPVKVILKVHRGPAYRLTAYRIKWRRPGAPAVPLARLGLKLGQRARGAAIVKAQSALLLLLADKSYPFAKVVNRRIVVDHAARAMRVTVTVDRGRAVRFGRAVITGAPGVDRGLIKRRLGWKPDAPFRTKPVRDARHALFATGVFSSVRIEPDRAHVGPDGRTPMLVRVAERKRHSVALTAYYDTSLGPGGEVEWLDRNLFGGAERLSIRLGGTFVQYGGKALFRKPDLFGGPQDLLGEARYQELNAPAYDGREAVAAVAINRRFGKRLSVKAGPIFDWSAFKIGPAREYFTLFGARASLHYDASDDRLDPTRGYRLNASIAPYVGSGLAFARAIGRVDGYWSPFGKRFTLAGWTRLSAVFGENRGALPPNKRIYAGGGNSIRGFGYQRVGPLDAAHNPIGGKSALEFGLEARLRITKTWGGVLFAEGGNVFADLAPSFNTPFRWGVGAGVRYKSPIGLLRLDLATPINRRPGDSVIQVYISIGQAF